MTPVNITLGHVGSLLSEDFVSGELISVFRDLTPDGALDSLTGRDGGVVAIGNCVNKQHPE